MNLNIDVSQPEYYYKFIIFSFILFAIVQLFIWVFTREETDLIIMDKLLDNEFNTKQKRDIIEKSKTLKFKYMSAYLLSKAAMWAKAPYTFILLSSLYNFNFGQIGVLYIIDAVCSLFSGPFIGIMADTFGRKIVAIYYPINTVVIIIMRLSGIVPVAYAAQILTGFAANVLSTSFEAWLNYEINKIYKDNPSHVQAFRKDIFSKISYYDSILSLLTAITGATIYSYFGIYFSLSLSIFLAICSALVIIFTWDENKPNREGTEHIFDSIKEGICLLKYPQILALGLVDSIYYCSLQIKMFAWTPILEETAHTKNINIGMIYLIMTMSSLIHNKILEFLNKTVKINFTRLAFYYLIFYLSVWFMIYYHDNYQWRLVCIAILNGSNGLVIPIISYLRSNILIEQYRALLMNLFRIPLNLLLIVMFILTSYINPFQLCLIIAYILIIPVCASIYLIWYQYKKQKTGSAINDLNDLNKYSK